MPILEELDSWIENKFTTIKEGYVKIRQEKEVIRLKLCFHITFITLNLLDQAAARSKRLLDATRAKNHYAQTMNA